MNKYFTALFSIHNLAVVAVTGPFVGAVLMLLLGITDVVNAYLIFFGAREPEGAVESGEAAMITLVASVDHFLFATILMIFGVGIYALIFGSSRGDGQHSAHDKHMSWNHLKNLGGMDEMLLKVIIMLLSVSYLEFVLSAGMGNLGWTYLIVPLAIVALGLCLRWMGASSEATEQNDMRREELEVKSLQSQVTQLNASMDELERVVALHEKGILDKDEFVEVKARLLRT